MFEKNLVEEKLEDVNENLQTKPSSFNLRGFLQKLLFVLIIFGFIFISISYLILIFIYPYVLSPHRDILSSYSNHVNLKENNFDLYWKVDNDTKIQFALKVKTMGWISIGFSLSGKMAPGSDVVMFYFDKDKKASLTDRYTTERKEPLLDTNLQGGSSNVELVSSKIENGFIIVEFTRDLNTGDRYDVPIKKLGPTNVIWAYSEKPIEKIGEPLKFHEHYGSTEISFIKETEPRKLPDKDVVETIIQVNNVQTVPKETVYLCKNFKFSELGITEEQHAVKFKALVDNVDIVHHMILFQCKDDVNTTLPAYSCFDDMPRQCVALAIWAVGSKDFYPPDKVGFPIGKSIDNLILQIHYNNPRGLQGIDSSGFIVYSTKNKREHEAGILTVGVPHRFISIPPRLPETIYSNTCNNSCTKDKINLFGYAFHMHTIGNKMQTEIYRNNQFIDGKYNNEYDFNNQESIIFDKEIEFKTNDQMTTKCYYNSLNRVNVTKGGFGSREEMCYNFIFFYPKSQGPFECISNHCVTY